MEKRKNKLFVYVLVFLLGMAAGSLALATTPSSSTASSPSTLNR